MMRRWALLIFLVAAAVSVIPAEAFQHPSNINLGYGWEPTLAIYPSNPPQIYAIAAEGGIGVFQYSSATASAFVPMQLPYPYQNLYNDGTVAFDSQGNGFTAYLAANPSPAPTDTSSYIVWRTVAETFRLNAAASPVSLTVASPIPMTDGCSNDDKPWITADANQGSPYRDNVYLVWSNACSGWNVMFSRSTDHGATWSTPLPVSSSSPGDFAWPAHVATDVSGKIYLAWRRRLASPPTPTADQIWLATSSDGGKSFSASDLFSLNAISYGDSYNDPPALPGIDVLTMGETAPYVLIDPTRPGNVYLILNAPDATHPGGVAYISRFTNATSSWSQPAPIAYGAAGTSQIFPRGAIDQNGNIVVDWFDTRAATTDASGNYQLNVYGAISHDGGVTWTAPFQINASAVPQPPPPSPSASPFVEPRVGEYIGMTADQCLGFSNWIGNGTGYLQIFPICAPTVTDVKPDAGPASGGTPVTVSGSNYQILDATSVLFGGATALNVTVSPTSTPGLTTNTLVSQAPPGVSGTTVDVTVSDYKGQSALTSGDTFSYFTAYQPFLRAVNGWCGAGAVSATVYGPQSQLVKGQSLQFSFGGQMVVVPTDVNGSATVSIPWSWPSQIVTVRNLSAPGTASASIVVSSWPAAKCKAVLMPQLSQLTAEGFRQWFLFPTNVPYRLLHPNPVCFECPFGFINWSYGEGPVESSLVVRAPSAVLGSLKAQAPRILGLSQTIGFLKAHNRVISQRAPTRAAYFVGPVEGFPFSLSGNASVSMIMPFDAALVPADAVVELVRFDSKRNVWTTDGIGTARVRGASVRGVADTIGMYTIIAVQPAFEPTDIRVEHE